jgi:hypothetical protein
VVLAEIAERTPAHVRVRVFVGPDRDRLALSGELTLRDYEWPELRAVLEAGREHRRRHPDPVPGCAACGVSLADMPTGPAPGPQRPLRAV